jgi:hypothetical protein
MYTLSLIGPVTFYIDLTEYIHSTFYAQSFSHRYFPSHLHVNLRGGNISEERSINEFIFC